MDRYPNISDHGLIGDLQTAALVSTDGTVDWFCCPRFDSPSVFASLLDADQGGYFRIAPDTSDYVDPAAVLPRHRDADHPVHDTRRGGRGDRLHARRRGTGPPAGHRLVRLLRTVRGTMRFVIEVAPRFDYGRAAAQAGDHRRRVRLPLRRHGADAEPGGRARPSRWATRGYRGAAETTSASAAPCEAGEVRGVVLESIGRPAPADTTGRTRAAVRRHRGVLAGLGGPFHLPGPLAGDGAARRSRSS